MKLLLLLLGMSASQPFSKVDRIPQSNPSFSGCDSRETAAGISASSRVPRNVIYHYGKKELLLKDVAEKNIPESDWNDYIMGEKTRFKLKRYRRGLYGTEYAEDADRFGDATYNWLVEIKIKPECLVPSRVVSLVYLSKNDEFHKWYELKGFSITFDQWKTYCFDTEAYPRSKYFIDYKNPSETADFKESICESVVADYFEGKKFAFVHDYAGDLVRSWAIRDRECISKIEGSELYWANQFAVRDELWVNTCNSIRNHRNNIRVWFSAIERAGVDTRALQKFSKMMATIKPPEAQTDWETQDEDSFAAQDFSSALLAAAIRCGSEHQNSLRAILGEIAKEVDELQSSEVKAKLESTCR